MGFFCRVLPASVLLLLVLRLLGAGVDAGSGADVEVAGDGVEVAGGGVMTAWATGFFLVCLFWVVVDDPVSEFLEWMFKPTLHD